MNEVDPPDDESRSSSSTSVSRRFVSAKILSTSEELLGLMGGELPDPESNVSLMNLSSVLTGLIQ